MYSKIILIFSTVWWGYTTLFFLGFILVLLLAKTRYNKLVANGIGVFLFLDLIVIQLVRLITGTWTVDTALPLQYCSIMAIASGIALLTRWKWSFELTLLLGMIAPLQAIISPGLAFPHGAFVLSYYLNHGFTIAAPLFIAIAFNMRPRPHSWWRVPFAFALFLPFICLVNYLAGANYMFLMCPPALTNPLILGAWPYYVVNWIILLFATSILIYGAFSGFQITSLLKISFLRHLPWR